MNPMVQIEGLKKNYGTKQAVKGIDLEIPEGQLFVLVGPNGAGKTTTLKMLVGLLKPTAGRVLIGGHDMALHPRRAKRLISFVPDTPFVYEKLTPWELLRFVGRLYEIDSKVIRDRGTELLRFFSIDDVENVMIQEFSHGMRQKVILAASLLHDPKLFILDEPMVGLDPVSIKSFKDFLKNKGRGHMTIIFSSHMLAMAEELADRIAILDHGQIVAIGSMEQLQTKYQSKENLEHMFMKLIEHEEIRKAGP